MIMFDINLVPDNLRRKKKGKDFFSRINIPLEVVIGSVGGLFLVLILVHLFLLFMITGKVREKKLLAQEVAAIGPEKTKVESVINEIRTLQSRQNSLKEVVGKDNIKWAKKFNDISDSLIQGVWIKKISFNEEAFFIKGSALSKQGREMVGVHTFAAVLKKYDSFMDGFKELSLGSIQMRKIKNIEIADFLIKIKIK